MTINTLSDWNTHLDPSAYDCLVVRCTAKYMFLFCYKINKQFWSLHVVPDTLKGSKKCILIAPLQLLLFTTFYRKMITLESEDVRESKLLRTIKMHTMNYRVGPLDFCGVADVITIGRKQYIPVSESLL